MTSKEFCRKKSHIFNKLRIIIMQILRKKTKTLIIWFRQGLKLFDFSKGILIKTVCFFQTQTQDLTSESERDISKQNVKCSSWYKRLTQTSKEFDAHSTPDTWKNEKSSHDWSNPRTNNAKRLSVVELYLLQGRVLFVLQGEIEIYWMSVMAWMCLLWRNCPKE